MFINYGKTLLTYRCLRAFSQIKTYSSRGSLSCCVVPRLSLRPSKIGRYAKVPEGYYGGRHMITLLPGHGIGPEMMVYATRVLEIIKAPIDFEVIPIRTEHHKRDLEYAVMSIRRNGACLKAGNLEDRDTPLNVPSANVEIRRKLDLYVSMVQCVSYPGVRNRHGAINIVVIRQNTEGEYAMLEHENKKGVVESMKIVTKHNCVRLAHWMFKYCVDHNRKKVTVVHKTTILKKTDGLFLNTMLEVAQKYPFLEIDNILIDRFCLEVVQNPKQFDVVMASNLYGSVITNAICGLIGGAGILSGRNYGDDYALFETATRNSAEVMANKNLANPVSILHACADMLWHLRHENLAFTIRRAVLRSFEENVTTADLGGTYKGSEVVDNIIEFIQDEMNLTCPVLKKRPVT